MSALLHRHPAGADERQRALLTWASNAEELSTTQRHVIHEHWGFAVPDTATFTRLFDRLIEQAEAHNNITRRCERAMAAYLGEPVGASDIDRDAALALCEDDIHATLALLAPPARRIAEVA